jgi:8-oxo-dGTP pyrophosphatase MutT (NUDIX family)
VGLVHGSLAPHCVLVTDQGVQLVGWMTASVDGVPSRLRDAFRRDVDFEAREARESLGVTTASDVYAAGAILLTAATGQWAGGFRSDMPRDVWQRAGVDGALGGILGSCLDPDPAGRPTAAELAEAFAGRADRPRERTRTRREIGPVTAQDTPAPVPGPPFRDRRWFPARDTFTLGGRVTDCHLYEGDGTRAIPERNVLVHHLAEHVELPAEVRRWRDEIEAEETRKAAAGEPHRWNSPRFALEGITVTRTAERGEPVVHLQLRDADYYDFLAVSLNLDRPRPGDGLTLRRLYLEDRDPVHAPAFLSSSFGVIVAVETGADGKMLFARSSPHVAGHPRRWNASVSEGLSGTHDLPGDGSPISFHATARRALWEELGVSAQDRVELELLGFGLDLRLHQWAAFFRAVLPDLGEEDLRRRWSRGVRDKWEHDSHAFVPADPDSVLDFILKQPERAWAPCAPALFYLALVRGAVIRRDGDPAGRLDVEAAERRAHRRHGETGPTG